MAKLQEIADTLNDNDIEWSIPDSGFYACMKINKEIQFDQIQLELLKNRICLMDTRMFFLNEFKNNNYLRISISKANEDEIALGINKLVKIIKNHLFDESIDAPKYKEHFDLDWIY